MWFTTGPWKAFIAFSLACALCTLAGIHPVSRPQEVRVWAMVGATMFALYVLIEIQYAGIVRAGQSWLRKSRTMEVFMRGKIDHYLVMAMAVVETVRGVHDVVSYARRRPAVSETAAPASKLARAIQRHRVFGAGAAVGALAAIPVLYYTSHAVGGGSFAA